MKIPYISGDWKVLFRPEDNGNYVNDHTIIRSHDGKYHLFGITGFGGGSYTERYFVHAAGEGLDEPMTEVGRSIDRGTLAWAPCVINRGDNYYMFYGPSPTQMAVSFDLYEWFGYDIRISDEPPMAVHRDHFVLKVSENEYLMYASGVHNKRGAVSLLKSSDLLNWRFIGFALTSGDDAPLKPGWGAMESPFIVKKDGLYYLMVTYTDCSAENYNDTLVFVSDDPTSFGCYNGGNGGAIPVTRIKAHAPEILCADDKYYITTCGWNDYDLPHPGCVSIAPLSWKASE